MSDLKLEVGKTYVFINDDAKEGYLSNNHLNKGLYEDCYKGGYKIAMISKCGTTGFSYGSSICVISGLSGELKYFKLKEDKMKPIDIIKLEITAVSAIKLKALISEANGDAWPIYRQIDELGLPHKHLPYHGSDLNDWTEGSPLTEWALSHFEVEKTEQEIQIEQLQKTIEDAAEQIRLIKGE